MSAPLVSALKTHLEPGVAESMLEGLKLVESELIENASSKVETVESIGQETLASGGKRVRPMLCWVSACATGNAPDKPRLAKLGAALEMVHMATLVHDDVIDEASLRRGSPTASALHGPTAAVLGGDVLLSRAMRLLALDGDISIIRAVAEMVVEMAEGEVRELEVRGRFDLDLESHLQILRMKTSAFMECACRIGAMAANSDQSTVESLAEYGHNLGMTFQLVDDLLDYRGVVESTGKVTATDFVEGQATLPLIILRGLVSEPQEEFLIEHFGAHADSAVLANVCELMDSSGAFESASKTAASYAECAREALGPLPDSPYKAVLSDLITFVLSRDS